MNKNRIFLNEAVRLSIKMDSFNTLALHICFSKKWANSGFFFIYFRLFKHITKFTTKNVHQVYDTVIQTHDLWNMSLIPKPLDQGPRPALPTYLLTRLPR